MEEASAKDGNLSRLTILALAGLAITNLVGSRRAPQAAGRVAPRGVSQQPAPRSVPEVGEAPAPGGLAAAPVDHPPGLIGVARSIIDRFNRDNASQAAAGIAFYLFVSIFPGLAALVSIYGLFGDPSEVGKQIAPFAGLLPPEAMKLLNDGLAGFIKVVPARISRSRSSPALRSHYGAPVPPWPPS